MAEPPTSRRHVLDHLGLGAGRFDARGSGDGIAHATPQNPEMRDLTVGEAVKAMVLNGLGVIHQARALVPRVFPHQPPYRLLSPRVPPAQLHEDARGRAWETLEGSGVTALYRLIAATAAKRLDLRPTSRHLDSMSFHGDGRSNSPEPSAAQGVHLTQGYSREHRPDLHQGLWEVIVEPHAGMPGLMQPRSGHSRDPQAWGPVIHAPINQLPTTSAVTYLVAESALYSEANLATLAQTAITWITRVPATVREAQGALAPADPPAMAPLQEGYRAHELTSSSGGVEPRWGLIDAEARQPQAQRTVDTQLRQLTDQEANACKTLCRPTFACEAAARQALSAFKQDVQVTFLATSTVRAIPRDDQRGRPGKGVPPDQVVDQSDGALASALTPRQVLIAHPRCVLLATNALEATQLTPQALVEGYKGQVRAERGFRFMKDPSCLASSLDRNKPERLMAL